MKIISCKKCEGHYVLRQGPINLFFGCSKYPRCRAQMDFCKYVIAFIKLHGVNLYGGDAVCNTCGKNILLYDYNLTFDIFEDSANILPVTMGMVDSIDEYIADHYLTVRKTDYHRIDNCCPACSSLQEKLKISFARLDRLILIENIPYSSIQIEYDEIYMAYN